MKYLLPCLISTVILLMNTTPLSAAMIERNAANNKFGFELFKTLSKQFKQSNLFISPFSVATALQMTYNGADGTTSDAMAKVLGIEGATTEMVNVRAKGWLTALRENQGKNSLQIANALFARKDFPFKKSFLDTNATYFGAETSNLDFNSPHALVTINGWVDKQTHGKIPKIIQQINPPTIMFLINAVYFKGVWEEPFDAKDTTEQTFHLPGGQTKPVKMMMRSDKYMYMSCKEFQVVRLPYAGKRLGMYIFLPAQNSSVDAFEGQLNPENWQTWVRALTNKSGTIALPRFRVESEAKLKKPLKEMGMGIAFDDHLADFTRMADTHGGTIYIEDVHHKTFVDVNEEGTEAAAATAVEMAYRGVEMEMPFEFVADRPFVVAIHDSTTDAILFLGKVMSP